MARFSPSIVTTPFPDSIVVDTISSGRSRYGLTSLRSTLMTDCLPASASETASSFAIGSSVGISSPASSESGAGRTVTRTTPLTRSARPSDTHTLTSYSAPPATESAAPIVTIEPSTSTSKPSGLPVPTPHVSFSRSPGLASSERTDKSMLSAAPPAVMVSVVLRKVGGTLSAGRTMSGRVKVAR